MALVLFVPSIEAVGSQYQQLNRACMLITEDTGPAKWDSRDADRPIISEMEWEGLEDQARLGFLREVMDAALTDMGVQQSVNLVACGIESDRGTVLGEYCFVEGEIRINMNHLRESGLMSCVETVLHEARHCFQHDVVQMIDWDSELVMMNDYYRAARAWREEFRASEAECRYFTTILREYLLWFFKSEYFIVNGVKSFTGTAGQQRIHKDYLATSLFPLPPLAEQKRIVAKIEELLPYLDRYEKAWNRLEDFNRRFPADMQKSILQMGTVKYYAQIHLQVWQNFVCIGQVNLPLIAQ